MKDFLLTGGGLVIIAAVIYSAFTVYKLWNIMQKNNSGQDSTSADQIAKLLEFLNAQIPEILKSLDAIHNAPTTEESMRILIHRSYDELMIMLTTEAEKGYTVAKNIKSIIEMIGKDTVIGILTTMINNILGKLVAEQQVVALQAAARPTESIN